MPTEQLPTRHSTAPDDGTTIVIAIQLLTHAPADIARVAAFEELSRYLKGWRRIPLAITAGGYDVFVGTVAEVPPRMPTANDAELLNAITAARAGDSNGFEIARRIHEYYVNRSRAERTPRSFLYQHLGNLIAIIDHLAARFRQTPPHVWIAFVGSFLASS